MPAIKAETVLRDLLRGGTEMGVRAYAATSVERGGSLDFHLSDDAGGVDGTVIVTNFVTGAEMVRSQVTVGAFLDPADPAVDRGWPVGFTLTVPESWPSGLYAADFVPGAPGASTAFFVVRGVGAAILVSIPFPTFHAYSYAGTPGASPYWNEQSDRGRRVSVNRPCTTGPGWETPILQWLSASGYPVDYCSGYDLHNGPLPGSCRLLVCVGHDEYWTREMRDNAEQFLASGGNLAFLSGNTCWWQFRLEGDAFVCYRDAFEDPLTGVDNARVTVEWTSAPVNRPENSLTGTSFRHGAGCWANTNVMGTTNWTTTFADHWVFEGTGLADGDTFGTGTVGYETDAVEIVLDDGVARITGRDSAPASFVVLAQADLASWRAFGQGGAATMGVFRNGGTVFNAATTGWGNGLGAVPDPVIDRITRNVLTRLSGPRAEWERIGHANNVTAMTVCENRLFASDANNVLWQRDLVGQNLNWTAIGHANDVRAMASQREATGGQPIGLYAVTDDGTLWRRPPVGHDVDWTAIATAPDTVALAASYEGLFAATNGNDLMYLRFDQLATGGWLRIGHANDVRAMTNMNGRLFCVTADRTLWTRSTVLYEVDWTVLGAAPADVTGLAGHAGRLIVSTSNDQLWWRD